MSPQDVPAGFADFQHHGSLFTLFLHSPLTAVCYICNVGDVPIHHWERCQGYVDKFVTEASRLVTRCRVDDLGKARDYIGIPLTIHLIAQPITEQHTNKLRTIPSRFGLLTVFRRRFPSNIIIAIYFLWCRTAYSCSVPWTTPAAEMRATTASRRFTRTSVIVSHNIATGCRFRRSRSIQWAASDRRWMILLEREISIIIIYYYYYWYDITERNS